MHQGLKLFRATMRAAFIPSCLLAATAFTAPAFSQEEEVQSVTIIEPKQGPSPVSAPKIQPNTFELGFTYGRLSVDDFATNSIDGFQASYHITSDYSIQIISRSADIDRATFERVIGLDFLSPSDREFKVTSALFGYRLFNGRSFFSSDTKFNSRIVALIGFGNMEFAGSDDTGYTLGLQYKTLLSESTNLDINFFNHSFERDFIGDQKRTQNLEFSVGLNVMF
ncbi:MAG: outer membrane beta-barrel domain-containing protein [Gammaproteobacteria bacterium]|nr:outer membrane beta-barrel domain-containing protein [Gammaproteobacteria bacterium]